MALTKAEALQVAGRTLIKVGNAVEAQSDGGEKLTTNEILDIVKDAALDLLTEYQDDEPAPE